MTSLKFNNGARAMSKVERRLREREEARKAAIAAKRQEKERETRAEETSQHFAVQFTSKKAGLIHKHKRYRHASRYFAQLSLQ